MLFHQADHLCKLRTKEALMPILVEPQNLFPSIQKSDQSFNFLVKCLKSQHMILIKISKGILMVLSFIEQLFTSNKKIVDNTYFLFLINLQICLSCVDLTAF